MGCTKTNDRDDHAASVTRQDIGGTFPDDLEKDPRRRDDM